MDEDQRHIHRTGRSTGLSSGSASGPFRKDGVAMGPLRARHVFMGIALLGLCGCRNTSPSWPLWKSNPLASKPAGTKPGLPPKPSELASKAAAAPSTGMASAAARTSNPGSAYPGMATSFNSPAGSPTSAPGSATISDPFSNQRSRYDPQALSNTGTRSTGSGLGASTGLPPAGPNSGFGTSNAPGTSGLPASKRDWPPAAAGRTYGSSAGAAARYGVAADRYGTSPDPYQTGSPYDTRSERFGSAADRYGGLPDRYSTWPEARRDSGSAYRSEGGGAYPGVPSFNSRSGAGALPSAGTDPSRRSGQGWGGGPGTATVYDQPGGAPSWPPSSYDQTSPADNRGNNPIGTPPWRNLDNSGSPYRPGDTGYNPPPREYEPGNTGYNPPGVPPYRPPTGSTTPSREPADEDPHYRPGSTSDLPSKGTGEVGPGSTTL